MNIAVLSISILALGGIALIARQIRLRLERYKEAEVAIAVFLDFNKQVTTQLQELEDQGRLCYQSLDGEAMRLIYEAQKMVRYGHELERLGIDALSTGNLNLLSEVGELFNFEDQEEVPQTTTYSLQELSPKAYKVYASLLLKRIDEKVSAGLQNRSKLYSFAA